MELSSITISTIKHAIRTNNSKSGKLNSLAILIFEIVSEFQFPPLEFSVRIASLVVEIVIEESSTRRELKIGLAPALYFEERAANEPY